MLPYVKTTRAKVNSKDAVYGLFVEEVEADGFGDVPQDTMKESVHVMRIIGSNIRSGHKAVFLGGDVSADE